MLTVELIETTNYLLALGTLGLQFLIALIVLDYFFNGRKLFGDFVEKYAHHTVFLFALAGACMTFVYSEIFGFIPCGLCWLQRVALYPLVLIFAIALWKKDRNASRYGIGLSLFGAIIALYQHYIQMGGSEFITCPAAGAGADCAERILFEFGYITFPLMSFSLFVFFIVILTIQAKRREQTEGV